MNDLEKAQWILLLGFGILFLIFSPFAKDVKSFFGGHGKSGKTPNIWLLTSSLVISWIFAKSITNAANLSLGYGMLGGLGYAMYYVSFIVAGLVIYQLRTKGGFKSLHHFLLSKYGQTAVYVFSLLIGFRLFNEVWSNTMVIGSYFGEQGSEPYYQSILVFTILTLLYTLKGGMSTSILTDGIQMIFFGILLFIILGLVLPSGAYSVKEYVNSSTWSMSGGLDFFFLALIQTLSYPFHDAVLTDRGFLSDPSTTRKSFFLAAGIGFICILAFSLVGVHARLLGLEGQAAVEVGKLLGVGTMLMMNFIMITSAASTLDSAFVSGAKLFTADVKLFENVSISKGRLAMILFSILGTLPVFLSPTILSATTVSGTMVLGLAPVFILWSWNVPRIAFHLVVGIGIIIGVLVALKAWPESLTFFDGKYGAMLSANIIGTVLGFVCFGVLKGRIRDRKVFKI